MRIKYLYRIMTGAIVSGCLHLHGNAQQENNMNAREQLHIGWASRDITPNGNVNISGQFHFRITDEVKDPLTVTALCTSSSKDCFIFVSCDIVSVPVSLIDEVRAIIGGRNPEIPVNKMVIHATHSHTAPDIRDGAFNYDALSPEVQKGLLRPAENRQRLVNGIVEAVLESWERRKPAMIAWGFGCAVVGRNRRVVYLNDFPEKNQGLPGMTIEKNAKLYGKTNVPDFSHIEGYEDHTVQFLFAFDMNKQITGAIINIATPSQESEFINMISADFWHEVRVLLREKYGKDLFILPQCAAAGDQISRPMLNRRAEERMRSFKDQDSRQIIAQKIGAAFDDALSWASKDIRDKSTLVHSTREIQLSRRMPTEDEYNKNLQWVREYEAMHKITQKEERYLKRCRDVVKRYQEMKRGIDLHQAMELHIIRLGDIAFATNSFELFLDYGIRIQELSPAVQTFIVQLAGKGVESGGSYLPSRRAELGGGYSAAIYCNQVGSKGGQELVEASVAELDKIWESSRDTYQVPPSDGQSSVRLYMKAPGLSDKFTNHGVASLSWDNENLCLNVEVSDPSHFNPHTGSRIWEGDSLKFAIMPEKDDSFFNIVVALTQQGVAAYQYDKKNHLLEHSRFSVIRDEARRITLYEVLIPLKLMGITPASGSRLLFNAVVHNDDPSANRWIEISPGLAGVLDTRLFPDLILSRNPQFD